MNRRTLLVTLTGLAVVLAFVAAVSLYQRYERQQAAELAAAQFEIMVRPHSPVVGPADAPVVIVEFFDPACEACRAFHPFVKQILAAHPDAARLVIRYTPFHGELSLESVRILEAAREQGLFEPVMDALLDAQPVWASHGRPAPELAWEFARAAGLNVELARAYVATGAADELLIQDIADVQAVGVQGTPTFFVNGRPLLVHSPQALYDLVRDEVESTRAATP